MNSNKKIISTKCAYVNDPNECDSINCRQIMMIIRSDYLRDVYKIINY